MYRICLQTALVLSAASTLAAAPVALSLTNAADYVSTIPVMTNLIKGVGMGEGGAYRTIRGEDAEFLASAVIERWRFASGSGTSWTELGNTDHYQARVPSRVYWPDYEDSMISNSYPASWGTALTPGSPYARHGFVPSDFDIWSDYRRSETTNGWVRTGLDARTDIRAVFASGASGFAEEDIPYGITNIFRSVPIFAVVTNVYAAISSDLCATILASASVYDGQGSDLRSCTTNAYLLSYPGHSDVRKFTYTSYTWDGNSYDVPSAYTLRDLSYSDFKGSWEMGQSMDCWIQREVTYSTPFGVRRTGESTGTPQVLEPYKSYESVESCLPSNGAPWTVRFAVVAGKIDSTPLYNTNIVAQAWLVSLVECTSTWTWEWTLGISSDWQTETTSTVSRAIASFPLGNLAFDPRQTTFSNVSNTLWSSSGLYAGYGTGVCDTQRALWRNGNLFFDNYSAENVEIANPRTITAADYPSTVTNGWGTSRVLYGQARTTRRHQLTSVKNYAVLLVNPVYFARIIGDYNP